MGKSLKLLLVSTAAALSLLSGHSYAQASEVEVALVDRLDGNRNNYCIDTMGGQERATPEQGLQGYTCYSYQDFLGHDQKMDADAIAEGKFLMTGFNVCMQAREATAGASLWGATCDGNELQAFNLLEDKTIRLDGAPDLCLSVGDETRPGRGGGGTHQYKDLTLEACSEERSAYQQWYMRTGVEAE